MLLNLARPYSPVPTPPHEGRLLFWSIQSQDFLFTPAGSIVIHCRAAIHSISLRWELRRNLLRAPFLTGDGIPGVADDYVIDFSTENLRPGFYDLQVTIDAGSGESVEALCTFGYDLARIHTEADRPIDFHPFWEAAKRELESIALAPEEGEYTRYRSWEIEDYNITQAGLPGSYDPSGVLHDSVESCKVSFASAGGLRIHGWLAKPHGPGPFPAMLLLPGAGFAARPRPLEHARHGYLALDIQIHGQDVDQAAYQKLPGYRDEYVFEPVEQFYYRNMYLHAVQGVRYLLSRAEADPGRLVVAGGSQGGSLSLIAAALEPRVSAVVAGITHFSNLAYIRWSEALNASGENGAGFMAHPSLPDTPEGHCLAYYDTMHFAPDVRCPVLMNAGLIDRISPPTGVFCTYSQLGSQNKSFVSLPGLGHDWSPEFDRRAWRWLQKNLQAPQSTSPIF